MARGGAVTDPVREDAPPRELDDLVEELDGRLDACFLDELREMFQRTAHAVTPAPLPA
jgi:hypothetical protein